MKKFFKIMFSKFWKLAELNLLFAVCCLPIVTAGPAISAVFTVTRKFADEMPIFIWTEFWAAFKKHFKLSVLIGIIGLIEMFFSFFSAALYLQIAKTSGSTVWYVLFAVSVSIGLMFIITNFYAYLLCVSANIPFKDIMKDAFILTAVSISKNILTLFISILVCFCMVLPILLTGNLTFSIFFLFAPFSFLALYICFRCYPQIEKYIIEPYYNSRGEKSPAQIRHEELENEKNIFDD
ncbi:MAG: DUF624 domain-containing protein [Oscillospiraceae bacterium]|jgi:uncharacterized membrane protein YesL|nr:DUF624 domain-containing protein [Oscillospiraceae bacterium]